MAHNSELGVCSLFLGLPALGLIMGLTGMNFTAGTQIAKFLTDFHFSVSALVAAMAGPQHLRSL